MSKLMIHDHLEPGTPLTYYYEVTIGGEIRRLAVYQK